MLIDRKIYHWIFKETSVIVKDVIQFDSEVHDVFEAIVDEKKHKKFSKNDVVVLSRELGGKCNWYNTMEGTILKFCQDKSYSHTWRASDWPKNHFAEVKMEFSQVENKARLTFTLNNPPPTSPLSAEQWKMGWTVAYWNPIKEMLNQDLSSS